MPSKPPLLKLLSLRPQLLRLPPLKPPLLMLKLPLCRLLSMLKPPLMLKTSLRLCSTLKLPPLMLQPPPIKTWWLWLHCLLRAHTRHVGTEDSMERACCATSSQGTKWQPQQPR